MKTCLGRGFIVAVPVIETGIRSTHSIPESFVVTSASKSLHLNRDWLFSSSYPFFTVFFIILSGFYSFVHIIQFWHLGSSFQDLQVSSSYLGLTVFLLLSEVENILHLNRVWPENRQSIKNSLQKSHIFPNFCRFCYLCMSCIPRGSAKIVQLNLLKQVIYRHPDRTVYQQMCENWVSQCASDDTELEALK